MSLFETYLDINNKIEKATNREEINDLIDKLNAINPLVLANVHKPDGWKTLKEEDLKIQKFKDLLSFTISGFLQRVSNYNEIKNVYDLIKESETINKNAPNQTSPYLRKVNVAVGKEIDFPTSVLSVFNKEDVCLGFGSRVCKTTAQDFDGVVIRLRNYFDKLVLPKNDSKKGKSDNDKTQFVINNNNINNVDVNVSIEVHIENVIDEVENDEDLSDEEIEETKGILNELKELKLEKPKVKWEKCKKVLSWLGDKSVKFGKWIIPIVAQILMAKNGQGGAGV